MYKLTVLSAALMGVIAVPTSAEIQPQFQAYGGKNCRDIKVPVTVDTTILQFNYKPSDEEIDTTNLWLNAVRHGNDLTKLVSNPNFHIKKDYTLAATICHPASGPSSTLQILTHGIGFDRSYWDYPFANYNYSYVARAVDSGYSTLSWDRLGIAESSHGDPVNEIQLGLEVEALHQLTIIATAGHLCGFEGLKFKKIVHIGHSFGSVMTYALASQYPSIGNAIVLTGFSQVPSYTGLFTLGSNFAPVAAVSNKLKKIYSTGYVVPKSSIGVQMDFFSPGDFDPKILADAAAHGQPAAIGELLTIGGGAVAPSNFTGAVQIINGENDLPFCGGNCNQLEIPGSNASDILQFSKPMFKGARVFETSIVKGGGHGLNLGFSHTEAYKNMLDFLKRNL